MKDIFFMLERILKRKFFQAFYKIMNFLKVRYTPLFMLVLFISGVFCFFILSYTFRYNHFDYWRWKNRAIRKTIFWLFLIGITKFILMEIAK